MTRLVAGVLAITVIAFGPGEGVGLLSRQPSPVQQQGITAVERVARAYDTILDADFQGADAMLGDTCAPGEAPGQACQVLRALALWWEISLDPNSARLDTQFSAAVERAIAAAEEWTDRQPDRAEAYFYLGAAYGARVQWRVLRGERLAAARDGKRIKEALERALAIDPELHDAQFGIGLYRYYADVAPAVLRLMRWLLMLPGGNKREGLQRMTQARDHGRLVRGEADYQLHLIYLWYEKRFEEALALVESLQTRYPRNPLFVQIEAEIHDVYFHDANASLAASTRLLDAATQEKVHAPGLASVVARLNMAKQLGELGRVDEAISILSVLVAEQPTAPANASRDADAMLRTLRVRRLP